MITTIDSLLSTTLSLVTDQLQPLLDKRDRMEELDKADISKLKSLSDIAINLSKEERARASEFDLANFDKETQLKLIDEAREIIEAQ